jgi:WD40 repeat protein
MRFESVITDARLSADGARVAVAVDNRAYVWDVESARQIAIFQGNDDFRDDSGRGDQIQAVRFSPDGRLLLTTSNDSVARVWDIESGHEFLTLRGPTGRFEFVAFSPDGAHLASASDEEHTARVWDISDARLARVFRLPDALVLSADYSPDGTRVVTTSDDNVARVWDSANAQVVATLRGHAESIATARFSPDGTRVITASIDNTARIWDAATGQELLRVGQSSDEPRDEHSSSMGAADLDPSGARLVTGSSGLMDRGAQVWDAHTGREVIVLDHPEPAWDVRFSADGQRIVTASRDGSARVWSAAGRLLYAMNGHDNGAVTAEFSPNGRLVVTAAFDQTARVWDVGRQRQLARLDHLDDVSGASFSRNGSRIVTVSGHAARLWDATTGRYLGQVRVPEASDAHFSPDGRDLLVSSHRGSAGLFYLNPAINADRADLRDLLCLIHLADRDASRLSEAELEDAPVLNRDLDGDPCRPVSAWTRVRTAVGLAPSWRDGATVADANMAQWFAAPFGDRLASAAVLARRAGQGRGSDAELRRAAARMKNCIEDHFISDEASIADRAEQCARNFGWDVQGAAR